MRLPDYLTLESYLRSKKHWFTKLFYAEKFTMYRSHALRSVWDVAIRGEGENTDGAIYIFSV